MFITLLATNKSAYYKCVALPIKLYYQTLSNITIYFEIFYTVKVYLSSLNYGGTTTNARKHSLPRKARTCSKNSGGLMLIIKHFFFMDRLGQTNSKSFRILKRHLRIILRFCAARRFKLWLPSSRKVTSRC